ncbi:MAG: class II fumarate hydratase [Cyanobacteriota bacterium]|nr:class II fumarate hydratase [Cyanobacteriota bacterium]
MKETFREERDSLGPVQVPGERLWGAQTQRSLRFFSIGEDRMPKEMIRAYALVKKAAAIANERSGHLEHSQAELIVRACDELLDGQHQQDFPLFVWMTGSGTQFNMNVNEVISNRCCQLSGTALGSKQPVHPNDHVNMGQSTNDSFPTAMHIAAVLGVRESLLPSLLKLRESLQRKADQWADLIKIGRTHLQDATPLTLGQEISGYVDMLTDNINRLESSLTGVMRLCIGGTAVGTGINTDQGFAEAVAAEIAEMTGQPFCSATNKFALQGAHDDLAWLSAGLANLAGSVLKIANDIRLLSCGPRAGLNELQLPANEPGSSIMPGKVNPTQCEAIAMVAMQVIANDHAVQMGNAGGHLQMNASKPLIIFNILKSIKLLTDGGNNFRQFLVDGMDANVEQINRYVERSLMLVTALSPVIGYENASAIAHHAHAHDLTLKQAALELELVSEDDFDRIVDPRRMIHPSRPGQDG